MARVVAWGGEQGAQQKRAVSVPTWQVFSTRPWRPLSKLGRTCHRQWKTVPVSFQHRLERREHDVTAFNKGDGLFLGFALGVRSV